MPLTGRADSRQAELRLSGNRAQLSLDIHELERGALVFRVGRYFVFPGLADVHVHLREPGFFYKETISTGTQAAARGGYTAVCAMPNLRPVPDCSETLAEEEAIIRRSAVVDVFPYGAISCEQKGQKLAAFDEMAPHVIGFSDDGVGVQDDELMRQAFREAARLDKPIAAHCEVNALLHGGCIHDGAYAKAHGLPGISSESEWRMIERDIRLLRETPCAYHVCHVSTKESVALIRAAKAEGINISCETAPHYLVLDDSMLQDDGRFKMNPPLRSPEDREALLAGILDGTIDMIATDHAPHSEEEKSGGLRNSLNGIPGLETAFPILYTRLVKPGVITLEKLITLMSVSPRTRFRIPGGLAAGDYTVFDFETPYEIDPKEFRTTGHRSPFAGETVWGRCKLTVRRGEIIWQEEDFQI